MGKMEVPLIFSARMLQDGKAGGLFCALSAIAKADAILPRLDRLTPPPSKPLRRLAGRVCRIGFVTDTRGVSSTPGGGLLAMTD